MGFNRENAAWQSKDKTWNIGFFPATTQGDENDGYDSEWDVDYDYYSFSDVFTGYKTFEEARRAAGQIHGNYGGSQVTNWNKENSQAIAEYEQMALWHTNPELAKLNQKKQLAKLNREHVKKLKEQLTENDDYKGRRVTITVKLDDSAYTRMGASQAHTGYVSTEGDWLVVGKQKVKNLKTGRLNPKLHAIQSAPNNTGGYGRGYGPGYGYR